MNILERLVSYSTGERIITILCSKCRIAEGLKQRGMHNRPDGHGARTDEGPHIFLQASFLIARVHSVAAAAVVDSAALGFPREMYSYLVSSQLCL
jgi:hypothetical protein